MRYLREGVPTVVFAGEEYGTGSSRDWAAKGTQLLGVKAVIARSFERIHRSNLAGMGVLPLQFKPGDSWEQLRIRGDETIDVVLPQTLRPQGDAAIVLTRADGQKVIVTGGAAHRHRHRGRILPARRHPAVRAAPVTRRVTAILQPGD